MAPAGTLTPVMITACECRGQRPHTHVPVKTLVLLDNGAEVALDATHYAMNRGRIVRTIRVIPASIEWWT